MLCSSLSCAALSVTALAFSPLVSAHQAYINAPSRLTQQSAAGKYIGGVAPSVRENWMRRANNATFELLGNPCGMYPYGAAIVNSTDNTLVALGANNGSMTGDGTNHGEINAINRAIQVLTSQGLTPSEVRSAMQTFDLYTNAESCPMCASAIRWAGMKSYIYGTSIQQLVAYGAGQILLSSLDVMAASYPLGNMPTVLPMILTNETDPMFAWQNDPSAACPAGCERVASNTTAVPMCAASSP